MTIPATVHHAETASLRAAPPATRSPRWPAAVLLVLAAGIFITLAVLKINALVAWRYTSDLFTVDLMLAETLRGNFMMEYAYGRQFGDHACLIFLALLPAKWVLGTKMMFLLVLLPVVTFALCGVILYKCARDIAAPRWAALATVIYFLSVGAIRGPFERTFGFHIDTLSGYVAVAMAALLMRYELLRRGGAAAITMVVLYALLKEEMALLGVIFFIVVIALRSRNRLNIAALLICSVLFAIEMVIIKLARTDWNRGNEALVRMFFNALWEYGIVRFFLSPDKLEYWLNVGGVLIVAIACGIVARPLNHYAAALVIAALAKLGFAWFVGDFYTWTWHNYPVLVMLTGGIALQALELRHAPRIARRAAPALVVISIIVFAAREVPYIIHEINDTRAARIERDRVRHAMLDILPRIDAMKVSSIPKWAAYEFTLAGKRHSFFPHGITAGPRGTADILVTRRNRHSPDPDQTKAFTLVYQNGHYRVWHRSGFLPGEETSRGRFIALFGREAIGLGPKKPPKPPKKKKRRPATSIAAARESSHRWGTDAHR